MDRLLCKSKAEFTQVFTDDVFLFCKLGRWCTLLYSSLVPRPLTVFHAEILFSCATLKRLGEPGDEASCTVEHLPYAGKCTLRKWKEVFQQIASKNVVSICLYATGIRHGHINHTNCQFALATSSKIVRNIDITSTKASQFLHDAALIC